MGPFYSVLSMLRGDAAKPSTSEDRVSILLSKTEVAEIKFSLTFHCKCVSCIQNPDIHPGWLPRALFSLQSLDGEVEAYIGTASTRWAL